LLLKICLNKYWGNITGKTQEMIFPVFKVKGQVIRQQIPLMAIRTNNEYWENCDGKYLGSG